MKTINRTIILMLLVVMAAGLMTCDFIKVRPLPTEKIITIFNSNLEITNKMDMLDTLFVQVGGLTPNTVHDVEVLDPDNNLIVVTSLITDDAGVIAPSPLWYDVGLRKDTFTPDIGGSLSLKSFSIHVTGPETDYTESFWIVYSQNNVDRQPNPVVWACLDDGTLENAFDETGTVDGKTQVYVTARSIPARIGSDLVDAVDVYIFLSKGAGGIWLDGDILSSDYTVMATNLSVSDDGAGSQTLDPTLIWDLDDPETPLLNPGESNCAYDVILDVNQNGIFDVGDDVNSDGVIDLHIDGVDGQGVVGFIVINTETNDFTYEITDINGDQVNSVNELDSELFITLKNIPAGVNPDIYLYETGTTTNALPVLTPTPTTQPIELLPSIENETLINTAAGDPRRPADVGDPAVPGYDLFIDMDDDGVYTADTDVFQSLAVRIIHDPDMLYLTDGTTDTTFFDETGTEDGKTQVYLRTTGLALAGPTVMVYIIPSRADWGSNTDLTTDPVVNPDITVADGNIDQQLLWDLNVGPTLINPTIANNLYDVVVDTNGNAVYDAGPDYLLNIGFTVRNTDANDLPDVYYVNIASGGMYGYDYYMNTASLDYRDHFVAHGQDTAYAYTYYLYRDAPDGRGIKASWNPYIQYYDSSYGVQDSPSLYYGQWVDVYIVDAAVARLRKNAPLGVDTLVDVAGGRKRIPVQYSCSNGAGQQNIWIPPFTVGSYYVIVDANIDGMITEQVDIIDAVKQDGTTIKDDSTVVGFSVYE